MKVEVNRNHLKKLSYYFNVDESELQTLWLADKLRAVLKNEAYASQAISIICNEY